MGLNLGPGQQPHVEISTTVDASSHLDHATPRTVLKHLPPAHRHEPARRMDDRPASSALLSPPELSPLEQEVLDEYERLADNMKNVRLAQPLTSLILSLQS